MLGRARFSKSAAVSECLGALTFFVAIYGEYWNARHAIDSHSFSIAEGVVSDFVPMPPGGHSIESFAPLP